MNNKNYFNPRVSPSITIKELFKAKKFYENYGITAAAATGLGGTAANHATNGDCP